MTAKKIWIACMLALACTTTTYVAKAQLPPGYRKLRADEISYLNAIHEAMASAIPHTYDDWTVVYSQNHFDAKEFWCDPLLGNAACNGTCPGTLGKTEAYTLSLLTEYSMPDAKSGSIAAASMGMVTDYTNGAQLAAAQKASAKTKIRLEIFNNLDNITQHISYCEKTPVETLNLPVPAALAVIGKRSTECPIMEDGRTSMRADYYDNAVIVLGGTVAKKADAKDADGLTTHYYTASFDKSKIGKPVTQNIVVLIKGDASDIKKVVAATDWQKTV